jgi:hypothetical protein
MTDCMAETIPSKEYEYLAAGRPIPGLVHRDAELAGMLSRRKHIFVIEFQRSITTTFFVDDPSGRR